MGKNVLIDNLFFAPYGLKQHRCTPLGSKNCKMSPCDVWCVMCSQRNKIYSFVISLSVLVVIFYFLNKFYSLVKLKYHYIVCHISANTSFSQFISLSYVLILHNFLWLYLLVFRCNLTKKSSQNVCKKLKFRIKFKYPWFFVFMSNNDDGMFYSVHLWLFLNIPVLTSQHVVNC